MWSKIAGIIFNMIERISIIYHRVIWYPANKDKFRLFGHNVTIEKGCRFHGMDKISVGNNVYIGEGARFMSTDASIYIGNYVMFGPEVTIITGDHRSNVIGEYMFNVKEKQVENDKDVIIENDVWIGAHVIILKGIHVGKGSIIGAGSIVTKEVEPYTIVAGVPAREIGLRFSKEQIAWHEERIIATKNKW